MAVAGDDGIEYAVILRKSGARMKQLVLCSLVVALAACSSARGDLDAICEEVTNPSLADMPPDQRATQLGRTIEARLRTTEIKNAWRAVASASPEMRYPSLRKAAEEVGEADWECAALESIWTPDEPAK